jgi:hypothetical protein
MTEERTVRTTLIIDEHGAVKAVHAVGDAGEHTEQKLGKLDKGIKGLGHSFGGLKGAIGASVGALGLGGLAYGLQSVISKTGEIAEETHKFHTMTGLGAESSLHYTAALKARGIGAEAGGNAFKFLAKNMQAAERQWHSYGLAQGKAASKGKAATGLLGVQATAFQELGINLAAFNGLSEEDKLKTITEHFEGLKDGVQKVRLESQIFGKGGTALSTVLDKGALSLSNYTKMANRFFPTIQGGAHTEEELLARQSESKMAWEGLQYTLGVKLMPVMTEVYGFFSKSVGEIEKGTGAWGEVEHTFESIAHFGQDAAGFIKDIAGKLGIHLGVGTLGAALAALAVGHHVGHKVAKPVKAAVKIFKVAKDIAQYGGAPLTAAASRALPLLATPAVGYGAAALTAGYAAYRFPGAYAGATKTLTPEQLAKAMFGEPATNLGGGGRYATAGGTPAAHGDLVRVFDRAINRMVEVHPGQTLPGPPQHIHVHLGSGAGREIAEAILHDPGASRITAEAVAKHAKKEQARR